MTKRRDNVNSRSAPRPYLVSGGYVDVLSNGNHDGPGSALDRMIDQTVGILKQIVGLRNEVEAVEGPYAAMETKHRVVELYDTVMSGPRDSHEVRLEATDLLRRAERKLALELRAAQQRGEVATAGTRGAGLPKLTEFGTRAELYDASGRLGMLSLASVSDDDFEVGLAEARTVGLRALSRQQLMDRIIAKRDVPLSKVRKTAGARKMMDDLAITLNALAFVTSDTNPEEVDFERHAEDIVDMERSLTAIGKFLTKVKEQGK